MPIMLISTIRTVLLYMMIIFAVRMMGKRQISEMQTSELVITLLMSNIASIPMQDTDQSMLSGVIPIMVLLVCEILLSYLMLKRAKIRRLVCGKPVIVIDSGKIDQQAMIQLRISTEDLYEQLRQKDIFDINEVAFAIVETNGKMSVMKKAADETVTRKDMKLMPVEKPLAVTVISDGELSPASMKYCGTSAHEIEQVLQKRGLHIRDVFLMNMDKQGTYQIIRKEVT